MSQPTLSSSVSGPRPGENTWLWLIKIVTGPLLVLVLILHFTGWLKRHNLEWLVLALAVMVFPVVIFFRDL